MARSRMGYVSEMWSTSKSTKEHHEVLLLESKEFQNVDTSFDNDEVVIVVCSDKRRWLDVTGRPD